jgi:hypothetical protein
MASLLCGGALLVFVAELPARLSAAGESGPRRLLAPVVEVRAVFCGSGCLAFETRDDTDLRLETSSGEPVPARHDDRVTRFDLGTRTGDVALSWRSHSFDPGVVLEFGGCDADGPPPGLRVTKDSSGRATLEATIGLDGAEPFLTSRLPAQ